MTRRIIEYFLPKDRIFYSLFEQASANLETLAQLLVDLSYEPDFHKRAALVLEMEKLEHQNDGLTHEVFVELGKNFITPFDREDIHSLATALDDIADYMYAGAKKINFYKIDPTTDSGIVKSVDVSRQAVLAVNEAVQNLRNLKNTEKIVSSIVKINSLENAADDLFDLSIERLFEDENDIKTLIKKREIYQTLESITDKCEDAGNVIESIVVKYA
jgi:hypothetical protein